MSTEQIQKLITGLARDEQADMQQASIERQATLLHCMAHPVRLGIVNILASGEKAVGAICAELGLEQSLVSHHLILMEARGFLMKRRVSKNVFYWIGDQVRIESVGGDLSVYVYPTMQTKVWTKS